MELKASEQYGSTHGGLFTLVNVAGKVSTVGHTQVTLQCLAPMGKKVCTPQVEPFYKLSCGQKIKLEKTDFEALIAKGVFFRKDSRKYG